MRPAVPSLVPLLLLLCPALGAEWRTSRGLHCTQKCSIGPRGGYEEVFWCPASDGVSLEHSPGAATGSGSGDRGEQRGPEEEDRILWDYCTPAPKQLEEAEPTEEEPEELEQGGQGGQGWNPGTGGNPKGVSSSLPGRPCTGPCEPKQGTTEYYCQVEGEPDSFACSPEVTLRRHQVSSHLKLWCIGECEKHPNDDQHWCKTLGGYDFCSPKLGDNTWGSMCRGACGLQEQNSSGVWHYQCDGTEDCGFWDLEEEQKGRMEYTTEDQVCASPCVDQEGELMCAFMEWQWSEDEQKSTLREALGICAQEGQGWGWTTWAILVGGILGGILIIGVVAAVVSKKGYMRAATSAP